MRAQLFFEEPDLGRRVTRYWLLLTLSAVIASAGVIGDSTATVIGAMIVAPLMVPILGTVLAIVLADRANLARGLALLVTGSLSVVAIAWLLGVVVDIPIVAADNTQVAARVSPRIIDLIAALATGAVGAIALAREDISDTLPGVAIAISLVPPLAVVGLTLEAGEPGQALGAGLLFLTNVSAILATGLVVMAAYRVARHAAGPEPDSSATYRRRAWLAIVAALAVICVPLAATSTRIATTRATESEILDIATDWAAASDWDIVSVVADPDGVTILATGALPEPTTGDLASDLAGAGHGDTAITVELVPTHRVELPSGG
jgi:uncharacterized hydrophobic protein (TIGR00271 family)